MHQPTLRRGAFMRLASARPGWAKLAVVAAGLAAAAAATAQSEPATTPRNVAAPALRDPERIYRQVCAYCHGHNVAPLIRGRGLDPATVEYFVRHGNGAMPAFKPTEISNQELAALAKWVSASKADPKEHGK